MKTSILILISIIISIITAFYSCEKLSLHRINKLKTDTVIVNNTYIIAKGTIVDIGEEGITDYGHCWSTSIEPTIEDFKTSFGSRENTGQYIDTLYNLTANTTYYIRAYINDGTAIKYGETKSFTTTSFGLSVSTGNYNIINESTVTTTGTISNIGSINIMDFGHCWSTTILPVIDDNKTSFGFLQNDTSYTSTLNNLNLSTAYYVRAYAKVDNSTVIYGDTISIYIPELEVKTDTFDITGSTNAVLYGTIVRLGINTVSEHGFCWSYLTSNPSINDNKISLGTVSQTGSFNSNLLDIIQGVTYYFRAYAIEESSVKYGEIQNFIIY